MLLGGAAAIGLGMYMMNNTKNPKISKTEHKAAEAIEKTGDKIKQTANQVTHKVQEGVDKGAEAINKRK